MAPPRYLQIVSPGCASFLGRCNEDGFSPGRLHRRPRLQLMSHGAGSFLKQRRLSSPEPFP